MQLESKQDEFKRLKLVLGKDSVQRLKSLSILVVGVGGIGCEVLKNLSKHPVKKVVIIDLDIIEISNLNRQFYFRKQHLTQSKAKVARQQILKLVPDLNIDALEGNIYDKEFNNFSFYSQFDVVISALDNMKARQHVARNCTRYGKILIDAGTSGFNGQSYSSARFATSCHNCYPSVQEENFAVCTIRSRPDRSIHCAIYAKYIYESIFSDGDLQSSELKQIKNKVLSQQISRQNQTQQAIKFFNYLFYHQFKSNEPDYRYQVNGLIFEDASQSVLPIQQQNSEEKGDSIWSLQQYAQTFIGSFCKLVERIQCLIKVGSKASLIYDKDDEDCSLFICCVCNLRVFNFKNSNEKSNKLKYLTFYECRKFIGNIIPAIASTNSISASLQIKQLSDLLSQSKQNLKYFTISPFNDQKISFSWISLPNPQCQVCSPHNIYFHVKCNLSRRTFQEFQQFALNHCFSHSRDLYCQNLILIKNINTNKISSNKKKTLNFKPDLIIMNSLTLAFLPTTKISYLKVQITLINDENEENELKFEILNNQQVEKTLEILNSTQRSNQNTFHNHQEQNINDLSDYQLID